MPEKEHDQSKEIAKVYAELMDEEQKAYFRGYAAAVSDASIKRVAAGKMEEAAAAV